MDNKDIAEMELTGCQGTGGERARVAASFVIWVLKGPLCHPCHHYEQFYILLPHKEVHRAVEGVGLLSQH